MPRPNVLSRPHVWPRVAVLALVGIAAAGCSGSARFDSNPFSANEPQPQSNQDFTGSVAPRAPAASRVEAQPLPAPSQPATVAAATNNSYAAQGHTAYRTTPTHTAEVTGSVAAPAQSGHWTWDGGSPVTVGYGESVETIARKYGVPSSAIMQTNGITSASQVKPGQRLVIPRYVSSGAPRSAESRTATKITGGVHVVKSGESLMGIARHYGITREALARANRMQPYAKLNIGDRLTIPGGNASVAAHHAPAPQVAQPRTIAPEKNTKVASLPAENARVVMPETTTTESVPKIAEAENGMPSFRWPVKGRVIAGFGKKPNGTENDGINLAVPEGTPIKAADDGVVAYAGNELKGYGNLVLIRHANGFVSAYANASAVLVKRGDTIKRGQVIARAGQTGNVTSPQLHFEIRKGSTPVDPTKYLSGA